ncbi:MAG: DUF4836 family protein [Sodaliphilus sp.]
MMELIPDNAGTIVSINPAKLIDHTGVKVDDNGKVELPGALGSMIGERDKKELDEAVQKLTKSGIDLSNNLFVYIMNDNATNGEPTVYVIAATKDAAETQALAEKEMGITFKNEGDISLAAQSGFFIGIKDDIVIFGGNVKDAAADAKKTFEEKENSIANNSDIASVLSEDKDINVYVNYEAALKMAQAAKPEVAFISGFLSGIKGCGYNVDLSDNEVSVEGKTFVDENADIIKLLNDVKGDASNSFMEHMPKDANILFSISIKGEKLAEFQSIKPFLESQTGSSMVGNANLTELVKSLNGPIAVGVSTGGDVKDFKPEKMVGSVVISTSKPAEWKAFLDAMLQLAGGMRYQFATEAKADMVLVKFGAQTNFALNCNDDKAKSIFSNNYIGLCINAKNNGQMLHLECGAESIKEGKGEFYILQSDGNKMPFADYPTFFDAIK